MSTFSAVNGQSLFDVCCNTYGSLDYLYKLLQDNSVANIDESVNTAQKFSYDNTLVVDQQVNRATTLSGKIFATAAEQNGNVYFVVTGTNRPNPVSPIPYIPPVAATGQYLRTLSTSYTATTDLETVIYLPALTGKSILQIENEIKPLKDTEFIWNSTTGTLTLLGGISLMIDQTLFILYQEYVQI